MVEKKRSNASFFVGGWFCVLAARLTSSRLGFLQFLVRMKYIVAVSTESRRGQRRASDIYWHSEVCYLLARLAPEVLLFHAVAGPAALHRGRCWNRDIKDYFFEF